MCIRDRFIPEFYFFYRKMWGWGALALAVSLIVSIPSLLSLMAALGDVYKRQPYRRPVARHSPVNACHSSRARGLRQSYCVPNCRTYRARSPAPGNLSLIHS